MRLAIPPASLLPMLAPVPRAATRQLRTLHRVVARGAPPGAMLLGPDGRVWVREGAMPAAPFRHRRRGAADLPLAVTFRLTSGHADGNYPNPNLNPNPNVPAHLWPRRR